MTLIIDNDVEMRGKPGLHALVAGVSAYPHLPEGKGATAPDSFGMQQLSSTALSAYKMYRWLKEWQNRLCIPLATCRLLLSPSEDEVAQLNGLAVAPCTQNNFRTAANEWRKDASSHKENVTFFYFAGHGVQRSKADQVLLMEDFGDGIGGALDKAVATSNLYYGMVPAETRLNTALTHLYFIDACRVSPPRFKNFEQMTVPDVFNVAWGGTDERQAPIFYAAVPGSKAYALKGEQTLFSKALLTCLTGGAGELKEQEDGQERWRVSLLSLSEKLGKYIRMQNQELNSEQDFRVHGIGEKDVIIHYLDQPPLVDIVFEVDPLEALPFTRVEVLDDAGQPIPGLPMPLDPHPYHYSLPAGYYSISARIQPPQLPFVDRPGRTRPVEPPGRKWPVRVLI
jgi:hypothetical protein